MYVTEEMAPHYTSLSSNMNIYEYSICSFDLELFSIAKQCSVCISTTKTRDPPVCAMETAHGPLF